MTDFTRFDAIIDEHLEDWIEELLAFCRIASEGGDLANLRWPPTGPRSGSGAPGARSRSWSWAMACPRSSSASWARGRAR